MKFAQINWWQWVAVGILVQLLAVNGLHAQIRRVEGIVLDQDSKQPIVTVQVRVQGRMQGVLTDANGRYAIEIEGNASTLEFSHIGYKKLYTKLSTAAFQNRNVGMEAANTLEDVVISSGPELVLEDKTIHLYDYEFFEGQLMTIIYDRGLRRSKLAIVDANDSIIDTELGIEEPGKLYRDCLGNVHAITQHWACQLFVDQAEIGYYFDSLEVFERTVMPCLGNIEEQYYFDYRRFNNQILDYLAYNMESQEWKPFFQLKDKNKIHQIMDPLGIYMDIAHSEAGMMALSEEDWKKVGKLNAEFQFEQMVFFYPVDAPLRVIDGKVYVFDHFSGLIRSFEKSGEKLEEVPISYHKLSHWSKAVIVDEVRNEVYTTYEKHGYTTLRKVDLQTGALGPAIEIPRQFPKKIGVRNGIAYFMYKQGIYDDTNRLFRMRL